MKPELPGGSRTAPGRVIDHRFARLGLVAVVGLVTITSLVFVTTDTCEAGTANTAAESSPSSAAAPSSGSVASSSPATPAPLPPPVIADVSVDEQVNTGAMRAAANDVEQAVAVVDRESGDLVAGHQGDTGFNSESITKLFTVAYYLVEVDGTPGAALAEDLRSLVQESNSTVQTDLWQPDIVPTIADRYQLTGTGTAGSSNTWGSDQITANDAARFLYQASNDPLVGDRLLLWMAGTPPTGADGFNQAFGFNALTGVHGSKQGWSDPGWSPANLHSVGYTDRYFAAVLQVSPTATYATMRFTSTTTVNLIAAATR